MHLQNRWMLSLTFFSGFTKKEYNCVKLESVALALLSCCEVITTLKKYHPCILKQWQSLCRWKFLLTMKQHLLAEDHQLTWKWMGVTVQKPEEARELYEWSHCLPQWNRRSKLSNGVHKGADKGVCFNEFFFPWISQSHIVFYFLWYETESVLNQEAVYNLRLFQWKFKASLNTAVHTLNKGMLYIVNGEGVNLQMFGNVPQIIITNGMILLDFVAQLHIT